MIETLIIVLIIVLIFGLVIWAVATYAPVPQPFMGIAIIILALIALLIVLANIGVLAV